MSKRYAAPDLFMSCNECGKLLIETTSGFLCCPAGHGKLKIANPSPEIFETSPVLWADTCRHCGWTLPKDQADMGVLYCDWCFKTLDKHAALAGIGE